MIGEYGEEDRELLVLERFDWIEIWSLCFFLICMFFLS